ncbi:MAG: NADH-quinone oxidoreductase subunit NuoH [Candidatus Tectomicrobia bacterium]|uniref:NADH-quinone oxidoreductase subunit H n=1 Tax=Tectimicrobiota bacterium TaxID=2528274 RepID=A0A932I0S6_UNCTE|nr:NADH-quinone oxidoreductase subunit NuoH [Candidatus Tectomicrobia bacterium]
MVAEALIALVKIAVVLGVVSLVVAYLTYLERKIIAHIQMRLGPMRVGWHGLLQPIADGLKLFLKEDIIPDKADKIVFVIAPVMVLVPAFVVYSVLPFSQNFYITQINVGIFFILAVSSLGVFGIVMAGWASNSKYSLLGALRSAAQMLSYEIFLGFSLIGPLMLAGSLNLQRIVEAQGDVWFVFYQPLAFVVFFIASLAETNRVPFDLPEAETELVAGFHTEYSGMKFAFFFLAEYANIMVTTAVAVALFFGGWQGIDWIPLPGFVWYLLKMGVLIFVFIWLRATLPRYRYDQLMRLGWKFMFPLVMANIFLTGLVKYLFL